MTSGGAIAAVDLGSTAAKGVLFGADGEILATAEAAVETRFDGARVEHDPAALAGTVEALFERLLAGHRAAALALTCQRSTCLLWERSGGQPLTAARSWQDTSQAGRVEALGAHAADVARRTGLRLSPHYAAPKLAALLDELPAGRERAAAGEVVAGTLDAFLARRLTGRDTTEPGHAGRTLLFHLEEGAWDPALCDLFGVPPAALPEVAPSASSRGEWRGTPLAALAGDQQAALLGHGGWRRGRAVAHFGTGAFVLAATGRTAVTHPGLLTAVLASTAAERRFQLEGTVNAAGRAVDWACELTGQSIAAWSERPLDAAALPLFLPSLAGAAAPWWRPEARGAAAGLDFGTGPRELVDAVVCGVGQRVLDCVDALRDAGLELPALRVSGKLTRLAGLTRLLADAGRLTVEVAQDEESGLAGVARLARATLDGSTAVLDAEAPIERRVEPARSADWAAEVRERWSAFVTAALGWDPRRGP